MIQRDGNNISLWQTVRDEYHPMHFARADSFFDVIIVGGGITGLSSALMLQKAGKKCLILEAANLGFGTTGGTTAHLNTLLDTPYTTISKNFSEDASRMVADAAAASINLIRKNIAEYQIDCGFEDTDAYLYSENDMEDKELDEVAVATTKAGVQLEFVDTIPISIPFTRAIRVPGQAKFNPIKYLQSIATAFEAAGGIIMEHCRVDHVKDGEPVQVSTIKGSYTCTDLIYATHIPPGINLLHLRCTPWRSYVIAVKLIGQSYPDSLIYDMKDPYYYYRSQVVRGELYLIAGGEDHKTGHTENTEQSFARLEAHVRKNFKVSEVSHRWSSQYFESADGLPYIGHLPGHAKHILVGTGYGGNGMIYGNVAAMVFRSIILGEVSPYEKLFSPSRIKPIAGFTNFISQNVEVVKNLAGRLISAEKLSDLVDLSRGEGKVVTYNHEKIGIYKDDNGAIHAIDPTCTHMKCGVKWNASELSWDCPCHGARFSYEGKVLTGPADRDLEKIRIEELVSK
ncbi:MAG: FAD-dependent oxidoreductase [Chitinophagaceae bacterium]